MRTDELMNIRANIINGNRTDAYNAIKDYGFESFAIDYLEYLQRIGFGNDGIPNHYYADDLRDALYLYNYHYNKERI